MRTIGVGVAAGLVAGVLLGAVAPVMMRFAAIAVDLERHFSLAETAVILAVFVVVTLPGAVVAAVSRRRARWVVLALGALLLCVPAAGLASGDLGDVGELTSGQQAALACAVAGVFAAILLLPVVTLRLIGLADRA